jgi:colanic acid biosynthesis protein WcaH
MFLEEKFYTQIITNLPILCVDLLIKNNKGQYLLHYRNNQPLKGHWWVPGGRVHKLEKIKNAGTRKCKEELGLVIKEWKTCGYYEDWYDENAFDSDTMFHGVSIVLSAKKTMNDEKVILDEQSTKWAFHDSLPERFLSNFKTNLI